jgi:hypothetical protein
MLLGEKSDERTQEVDVKSCFGGCNSNSMIDFLMFLCVRLILRKVG